MSRVCECPRCRRRFRVPDDEYGDHPCPKCGWYYDIVDENEWEDD